MNPRDRLVELAGMDDLTVDDEAFVMVAASDVRAFHGSAKVWELWSGLRNAVWLLEAVTGGVLSPEQVIGDEHARLAGDHAIELAAEQAEQDIQDALDALLRTDRKAA